MSESHVHDVRAMLEHADDTDPNFGLAAVGSLRRWLAEREEDLVKKARVEGWSWFGIAEALGRSRQAVWEKYREPIDPRDTIHA
jgi:hypothetical protein